MFALGVTPVSCRMQLQTYLIEPAGEVEGERSVGLFHATVSKTIRQPVVHNVGGFGVDPIWREVELGGNSIAGLSERWRKIIELLQAKVIEEYLGGAKHRGSPGHITTAEQEGWAFVFDPAAEEEIVADLEQLPHHAQNDGAPIWETPELAQSLAAALQRLKDAKRPVIIVGYGALGRMDHVLNLAEKLKAPVLTTFKAKGQIADDHPLAAGVLGRSGTPVASWCMNESDLLVVFGASFSNHTGITAKKPIIQVDFDAMTLGKFHPVDLPVLGEIGLTAEWLWRALPEDTGVVDQQTELAERWQIWRDEKAARRSRDRGQGINSAGLFETLSSVIPADAVIAVDVGNNTYSFGRYFECRRQAVLMSGYLGSIGFAR